MFTLIFSVLLAVLLVAGIVFAFKGHVKIDNDTFTTGPRIVAGVVAFVSLVFLCFMSVASVGATEVGVPITLGKPGGPLGPGPHLILPWTDVKTLDVKTQALNLDDDNTVKTITSDRIQVPVDATVYFSVDKAKAPTLLLTVGNDYVNKIVSPVARSVIYDQGSVFSSEAIQNQRDPYETAIEEKLKAALAPRGIILEKVELKRLQIPDTITNNAQAKINAEEAQKRARIDAETAKIEAQGKAAANKIVSDSISKNPAIICNNFVEGLKNGSITGPIYINPCGGDSNGPNLLIQPPAEQPKQ